MKKYLIIIFIYLFAGTAYSQSYDPKNEIFTFTETLLKCEGGVKNINKVFNKNYSTNDENLKDLKSLTILINYNGKVSITGSQPKLDSILIDSVESMLNSIKWIPAHQRQQATNFQAILGLSISKNKLLWKT